MGHVAASDGASIKPWLVAASASWGVHLAQMIHGMQEPSKKGADPAPPDGLAPPSWIGQKYPEGSIPVFSPGWVI